MSTLFASRSGLNSLMKEARMSSPNSARSSCCLGQVVLLKSFKHRIVSSCSMSLKCCTMLSFCLSARVDICTLNEIHRRSTMAQFYPLKVTPVGMSSASRSTPARGPRVAAVGTAAASRMTSTEVFNCTKHFSAVI